MFSEETLIYFSINKVTSVCSFNLHLMKLNIYIQKCLFLLITFLLLLCKMWTFKYCIIYFFQSTLTPEFSGDMSCENCMLILYFACCLCFVFPSLLPLLECFCKFLFLFLSIFTFLFPSGFTSATLMSLLPCSWANPDLISYLFILLVMLSSYLSWFNVLSLRSCSYVNEVSHHSSSIVMSYLSIIITVLIIE